MTNEKKRGEWCPVSGCEKYETNPDAFVAHLILEHDKYHKSANEITRERFEDYNLELHDPDYEESMEDMPICIDCGYHVENSNSEHGEYFCSTCNAVLREEDVREP